MITQRLNELSALNFRQILTRSLKHWRFMLAAAALVFSAQVLLLTFVSTVTNQAVLDLALVNFVLLVIIAAGDIAGILLLVISRLVRQHSAQ
jgi:hypothetical protein